MGHIRVQDETKKRSDLLLAALQSKNPNIKTYDDFQNYLLDKANVKPLALIIKDDVDRLGSHLQKLHPEINPNCLNGLMSEFYALIIESHTTADCKLSTKRIKELYKELETKAKNQQPEHIRRVK